MGPLRGPVWLCLVCALSLIHMGGVPVLLQASSSWNVGDTGLASCAVGADGNSLSEQRGLLMTHAHSATPSQELS